MKEEKSQESTNLTVSAETSPTAKLFLVLKHRQSTKTEDQDGSLHAYALVPAKLTSE